VTDQAFGYYLTPAAGCPNQARWGPSLGEMSLCRGIVIRGIVIRGIVIRGIVIRGIVIRGIVIRGIVIRGNVIRGLYYT
jgi:hypothetical protein